MSQLVTLDTVARTFFRPERVADPLRRARQRVVSRFLYFVMQDARQGIRRRKNASRPGQPPTNRTGLLKSTIFYGMDSSEEGGAVGAVPFNGRIRRLRIPQVLEHGGQVPNRDRHGNPIVSTIEARPFMQPALNRQRAKRLPGAFENILR